MNIKYIVTPVRNHRALTSGQAGFLRSSAKVILYPKPLRRGPGSQRRNAPLSQNVQRLQISSSSPGSRSGSPFRSPQISRISSMVNNANWICPICSFSNPVPSNFEPATATESFPVPPCLSCGIPPPFATILKAAIAGASSRSGPPLASSTDTVQEPERNGINHNILQSQSLICPMCTFHNHPSLQSCEMCGFPLTNRGGSSIAAYSEANRAASPAPEIDHINDFNEPVIVKLSFRAGGDKVFSEKLKAAMIQRKWLATYAPPIPKPLDNIRRSQPGSPTSSTFESRGSPKMSAVGIAGLEQRGLQTRQDNELVIGSAFEDLEALMALNKEVVALAQKLAREFGEEANMMDSDYLDSAEPRMVATRDMLSNTSDKLYISELARNVAEYVTDERRGLLRRNGGTMSLADLWATFNRSQDGVQLVSPSDFFKAAGQWAVLGLPVRLRQFKSGILAVQRSDANDERTVEQIKKWLESLRTSPPDHYDWDWTHYGCGVTAQDAAKKFGWSLGIATEELEMAEERGALCRDQSIEGLKFWLNFFGQHREDEDLEEYG